MRESTRRELFRAFEIDYWRLVNMRAERERVVAEIKAVAARRDALLHLIQCYEAEGR